MPRLKYDLDDLYIFSLVVKFKGFSAAADAARIPKSRVSRRVSHLEEKLGVRLLNRTSRQISLTHIGKIFYDYSLKITQEAHQAQIAVSNTQDVPSGVVRLTAPMALSNFVLSQAIPEFMKKYPEIKVIAYSDNQETNLILNGIDFAIRGIDDSLPSSSLIQVPLCQISWGLFATPEYIIENGAIEDVHDIKGCNILLFNQQEKKQNILTLYDKSDEEILIEATKVLECDDVQIIKQSTLHHVGIACLPNYSVRDEVLSGTLIHLLPQWKSRSGRLVILYPSRNGLSLATKLLLEYFKLEIPRITG
ncbi:LysR family transcriptional regulator [Enterobacter hormaechei]|uniref:LysR family transcriptional regulator n=1 Tax=Enterobacter hormaechei TaxID=158836 RepID=UPI0029739722|nr:LysR family transcriptional regulator [Enterobacter cloacae]